MWILWTVLGIFAFVLLLTAFWVFALLHMREGMPVMRELDKTVFAHRGLHDEQKPENSMAAFAAAADKGFGIEFDLHLTRDGRLVVMHDATTRRLCGQELKINDSTLEELRALRLPDGSQIPTFEEFLALIDGRVPLLIELKNDGSNAVPLCAAAMDLLKDYKGKYIVESFDPRVVYRLKKAYPDVVRGQLSQDFFKNKDAPWYMRPLLASMVGNLWTKPDFIAYNVKHRDSLPLKLLNAANRKICFWTVRDTEEFERCVKDRQNPIFEKILPYRTEM